MGEMTTCWRSSVIRSLTFSIFKKNSQGSQSKIALFAELALEEAMNLQQNRLHSESKLGA